MPQGIFPNGNKGLFIKGHKNCLGRIMSDATKLKISKKRKSQGSPWVSKRNKRYIGCLNHNYRGDKSKSLSSTSVDYIAFTKNNPKCFFCGTNVQLIHHKNKNRSDNSKVNFMSLCYSCHAKLHNKNKNFRLDELQIREKLSESCKLREAKKKLLEVVQ